MINRTELEARCSHYLDWVAKDATGRHRHIADLGVSFDENIGGITKKQKLINGLNMQCDMMRASEYPSDADTITAILYNDTDKLTEIKNSRASVDTKYPKVT
jgi:hypothetical protein|tara:strand:- start:375 stop:680 length:306 start_codon:yes stop_codon:yes gene_type:complete